MFERPNKGQPRRQVDQRIHASLYTVESVANPELKEKCEGVMRGWKSNMYPRLAVVEINACVEMSTAPKSGKEARGGHEHEKSVVA